MSQAPAMLPRALVVALLGIALVGAAFAPPASAATTYYVATSGNDGSSGSQSRPWRTIERGLRALRAGDTLVVRGGTYRERIKSPTIRQGSSTARITVRNYPGERVVIAGLLWLRAPSYWTFSGINVTWSTANSRTEHMVKFTDGIGWHFTRGEIWGSRSYASLLVTGTTAGQPANWAVTYSCIHDAYPANGTNQDHNVYVNTGTSAGSGRIERNLIFGAPNGRNIKLGPGGSVGGSVNVRVAYNTVYNAAQPISPSYDSNRNLFVRNLIGRSNGYALIHAYNLRGRDNVARENLGFGGPRLLGASGGVAVVNGGRNVFPLDPKFDSVASCRGFHPTVSGAKAYGRYAP